MNLTSLIGYIEESVPNLLSTQEAKQFIGKIENIIVPDKIVNAFQKIQNEIGLDADDIQSLNEELTKVSDVKLHDTLVYLLHTLAEKIVYTKHDTQIAEIEKAKTELENKFFTGQDFPQITHDGSYDWLLNYQKLTFKQKERQGYNSPIYIAEHQLAQEKIEANLSINTLILLNIIPRDYLTALDYPVELKKIHSEINNEYKEKEFIVFSKKYNSWDLCNTFLASNGETLIYAADGFRASHQYEPFDSLDSDTYTDKKRTSYHNADQTYWNSFSDHQIKKTAVLLNKDPQYRNLKTLFLFLAEKRQVVAQRLNHGRERSETSRFGKPRYGYGSNAYRDTGLVSEYVGLNSGWKDLFTPIRDRLEKVKSTSLFEEKEGYFHYQRDNNQFNKRFNIVCSFSWREGNPPGFHFCYPFVENEKEFDKNFQDLEPDFQNLLSWEGDDLEEFIKNIGKLSYSLYRLLPISLGNSAVVNWLVRAVALSKGVELGPHQDNKDNLGLDWESFVTFDQDCYAEWFLIHAYTGARYKDVLINLNSAEKCFEWKKNQIQRDFLNELKAMNQRLNAHDQEEAEKLFDSLNEGQAEFFKHLTPDLNETDREALVSEFRTTCKEHFEAADRLMGHGWLYRIAEVALKAVGVLFAGLCMAAASVVGRGFAKAEDRQRFNNYFFSLNQAESSKDLQQIQGRLLGDGEKNQGLLRVPM